jgi:hypothetical protein
VEICRYVVTRYSDGEWKSASALHCRRPSSDVTDRPIQRLAYNILAAMTRTPVLGGKGPHYSHELALYLSPVIQLGGPMSEITEKLGRLLSTPTRTVYTRI